MPTYIKITHEDIEKLRDKVSPEVLLCLQQRVSTAYLNREEKLKKKLKSLKANEDDITFIISCFKKLSIQKKPRKKGKYPLSFRHDTYLPNVYKFFPTSNYRDDT